MYFIYRLIRFNLSVYVFDLSFLNLLYRLQVFKNYENMKKENNILIKKVQEEKNLMDRYERAKIDFVKALDRIIQGCEKAMNPQQIES